MASRGKPRSRKGRPATPTTRAASRRNIIKAHSTRYGTRGARHRSKSKPFG